MREIFPNKTLTKDSAEIISILDALKEENRTGMTCEAAEASLRLRILKHFGEYRPAFTLNQLRVITEHPAEGPESTAVLDTTVGGKEKTSAGKGRGPVHALGEALTKSLEDFFPEVKNVRLTDYKVRVLNPAGATAARVRVLITSTDGSSVWSTVGVSDNIVKASWDALSDSVEYFLTNKTKHSEEERDV